MQRNSTLALTPAFQDNANLAMKMQIAKWHWQNPYDVSIQERMQRVTAIEKFILESAESMDDFKSLNEYKTQQPYLNKKFSSQIDTASKYLVALDYSSEMYDIFSRIRDTMIAQISQTTNYQHLIRAAIADGKLEDFYKEISELFFDTARNELSPLIRSAPVDFLKSDTATEGWINLPKLKAIIKGDLGPIFINKNSKSGNIINTICHEATHHVMYQWAGMVGRGEITVSKNLQKDAESIVTSIVEDFYSTGRVYKIYSGNPFEKIAFFTADGMNVECQPTNQMIRNIVMENQHFNVA